MRTSFGKPQLSLFASVRFSLNQPAKQTNCLILANCHIHGMASGSSSLIDGQRLRLMAQVRRNLEYFNRLVATMEKRNWPADDPVYLKAVEARDAVQGLMDSLMPRKEPPTWTKAMNGNQ